MRVRYVPTLGAEEKLGDTAILVLPLAMFNATLVTFINSLPLIKFSIEVTVAPIKGVYLAT